MPTCSATEPLTLTLALALTLTLALTLALALTLTSALTLALALGLHQGYAHVQRDGDQREQEAPATVRGEAAALQPSVVEAATPWRGGCNRT
jgi:membrane protein implicated in regulation of membrane protease activity